MSTWTCPTCNWDKNDGDICYICDDPKPNNGQSQVQQSYQHQQHSYNSNIINVQPLGSPASKYANESQQITDNTSINDPLSFKDFASHLIDDDQQYNNYNIANIKCNSINDNINNNDDNDYLSFSNFNQNNNNNNNNNNISLVSTAKWKCIHCFKENQDTLSTCPRCGFNRVDKQAAPPINPSLSSSQSQQTVSHINHSKHKPKQDPISKSQSSNNITNQSRVRAQSMWEIKQQQIAQQSTFKSINNNYKFGDQVYYPKDYNKFENELKINNYDPNKVKIPSIDDDNYTPDTFSIASIITIDMITSIATVKDSISNNNQNININYLLLTPYDHNKYSKYKRGESITFYSTSCNKWIDGRIEQIDYYNKTVAITYGNDQFTLVPIFYIKQYKDIRDDEWSNSSDFVLREYVTDVATEIAKQSIKRGDINAVIDLDEFKIAMDKLGIRGDKSRNRAFAIFDQIKHQVLIQSQEEKDNIQATQQLLMNEGYTVGTYKCIGYCKQTKHGNGACLTLCKHCICIVDFKLLIDNVIHSKAILKCPKCSSDINPIDIQRHCTVYQYAAITQMQIDQLQVQQSFKSNNLCLTCGSSNILMDNLTAFVCIHCGSDNCLKCKSKHNNTISCIEYNFDNKHSFKQLWTYNFMNNNDIVKLQNVDFNQNKSEWNNIVNEMNYTNDKIIKIERIENPQLWNKYIQYSSSLGGLLKETRVWHGTRKTKPSLIYTNGFDKTKSRVGKCLWYAVNSLYSMNGFQHTLTNDSSIHQLFLCLIATGDTNHVKYIRNNKILNVYKNEATYPAYLITYKK